MRHRPRWQRTALAAIALSVALGSAAIAQQGPGKANGQGNGYGGVGRPPANLPSVPPVLNPPPVPPGAIAASERHRVAAERGEDIPIPVWDPATGDMARYPDGGFIMSDRLRYDPKTGALVRNPDGSLVVGEPTGRPCPTPEGCPR